MIFSELLASPLLQAVNFFKKKQLNYKLSEIKPPFMNESNLKNGGTKRVLKIDKEKDYYLITWSFQYNS